MEENRNQSAVAEQTDTKDGFEDNQTFEFSDTESDERTRALKKKRKKEIAKSRIRIFLIAFAITFIIGAAFLIYLTLRGRTFGTADTFASRGAQALEQGNLDEAEENFKEALSMDEGHLDARIGLCNVYEQRVDYQNLYEVALKGTEISPATYEYYCYVLRSLTAQNRLDEARDFVKATTNSYVLLKMEHDKPSEVSFSRQSGTYGEAFDLSLASSKGATIYYTTDGTQPSVTSDKYSKSFRITDRFEIRAFAVSESGLISDEVTAHFRVRNEESVYVFKDEAVEDIVRSALGNYGDLTFKDMDELTSITTAGSKGTVYSLEDFAELLDVNEVTIKGDDIKDFSPLAQMPALRSLSIENIPLTQENLKEIASCVKLSTLSLKNCDVTGVSAFTTLTSLTNLYLDDNKIGGSGEGSFVALKDIKLANLSLKNNGLTRVDSIGSITNLRNLDISENEIVNLEGISKLSKLDNLNASKNKIESITGFSFLENLKVLNLSDNNLTDINDLGSAKAVSTLDLSGNEIESFSPLRSTNLASLTAKNCGISDLSSICEIVTLRTLDVSDNYISDTSPVVNLAYITELRIENNRLTTIAPLRGVNSLNSLYVKGNEVDREEQRLFANINIYWE